MSAPAATPLAIRTRRDQPPVQTRATANSAIIADAGAAGYSVTVAHPAISPATNPHSTSPPAASPFNLRTAANAKSRHAPASACAQKSVAYAHIGDPSPMPSAPKAAALVLAPKRNAIQYRHAHATAVGSATENNVQI